VQYVAPKAVFVPAPDASRMMLKLSRFNTSFFIPFFIEASCGLQLPGKESPRIALCAC
jgi:hypothetical protein